MEVLIPVGARRYRVLLFQHAAEIGGASWCLLELVLSLDPEHWEAVVVVRERGPLVEALRGSGVEVHVDARLSVQMPNYRAYFDRPDWPLRLPYVILREARGWRRTIRAAAEWSRRVRPDVVHINSVALYPAAVGVRVAGGRGVTIHNREHWVDYSWHPLRSRLKNRVMRRDVDRIFAITSVGARVFGTFDRSDIVRDWPSFDPRGRNRNVRQELGLSADDVLVVVPGGPTTYKGTRVAMRAWNYVKSPSARALFLGYESSNPGAGGCARDFALICPSRRASVSALPRTIDMRAILSQSNIVISPFTFPHASKAVLDAGSLAVPSIASDWEESREYIQHDVTGVLVPPCNVEALADAIDRLASDRERACALGRAAREKVNREFNRSLSLGVILSRWSDLSGYGREG